MSSLFDTEENPEPEVEFDPDSKIRLFETQQREERGLHDHLKRFLPVAIVAIVIVAVVIYMMQPGIGSPVKPTKQVEDAVYDYMLKKEHRSVREITFYNCDGYYWVKILAEPRSTESVDDPANKYRLRVDRSGDAASNIETLPMPDKAADQPCK